MLKIYKRMCDKLKISYKKNLILNIVVSIVLLILAVFLSIYNSIIIGFLILLLLFVYLFLHYLDLKTKEKQMINSKEIAFNGFYRYVITLLKNNQVLYGALQSSLEYVDEVLYDDVNDLIIEIEDDTSLNPFLKFSENFNDETIKQMIILLYKTQDVGILDDVLNSINLCMVNLQDTSIKNYISKEEKIIEKYYIYPIILSAAVILVVTMFVFTMIGDSLYV